MRKLTLFVILLLSTLVVFGCSQAQQKPAPTKQTLIPKESAVGFTQVDIDELPASIQKVASSMDNKLMATWAYDSNNSYILLNTAQDAENLKVNKIVQRVPVQDFLWLDVKLDHTESEMAGDNNNNSRLIAVKLDKTDKAINGVGFELEKEPGKVTEDLNGGKPQAAPVPAPTPAPITKEPASQAGSAQKNKQLAPEQEISPEEEQTQENSDKQEENKNQYTPATPNSD